MSKGKMISQAAHASLNSALKVKKKKLGIFKQWKKEGQKKVILMGDLETIEEIKEKAESKKIMASLIKDRGLTELQPGTKTALALGPDQEGVINKLTSSLPLV